MDCFRWMADVSEISQFIDCISRKQSASSYFGLPVYLCRAWTNILKTSQMPTYEARIAYPFNHSSQLIYVLPASCSEVCSCTCHFDVGIGSTLRRSKFTKTSWLFRLFLKQKCRNCMKLEIHRICSQVARERKFLKKKKKTWHSTIRLLWITCDFVAFPLQPAGRWAHRAQKWQEWQEWQEWLKIGGPSLALLTCHVLRQKARHWFVWKRCWIRKSTGRKWKNRGACRQRRKERLNTLQAV